MLDLTIIDDLIPNVLKYLSYEYHILFLKYLDSDDKNILNKHKSYIFCQLLLANNLFNIQYILNLKKVISPKSKFNDFFHEKSYYFYYLLYRCCFFIILHMYLCNLLTQIKLTMLVFK